MERGYQNVSLDKLVKADWNYKVEDEVKTKKLTANIKRNGQIENILIRELDTGYLEVVNGNHRYDALSALKFEKAFVYNLGKISLSHAMRIAVETNETRFESDQTRFAETIKEILGDFTMPDLEATMPFSEDELKDFAGLLDHADDYFSDEDFDPEVNMEEMEDAMTIKLVYPFSEYQAIQKQLNEQNLVPEDVFREALNAQVPL